MVPVQALLEAARGISLNFNLAASWIRLTRLALPLRNAHV